MTLLSAFPCVSVHRLSQNPRSEMSLKIRRPVGTATGLRDMPPYVTMLLPSLCRYNSKYQERE
jgi:hypothetical protein